MTTPYPRSSPRSCPGWRGGANRARGGPDVLHLVEVDGVGLARQLREAPRHELRRREQRERYGGRHQRSTGRSARREWLARPPCRPQCPAWHVQARSSRAPETSCFSGHPPVERIRVQEEGMQIDITPRWRMLPSPTAFSPPPAIAPEPCVPADGYNMEGQLSTGESRGLQRTPRPACPRQFLMKQAAR